MKKIYTFQEETKMRKSKMWRMLTVAAVAASMTCGIAGVQSVMGGVGGVTARSVMDDGHSTKLIKCRAYSRSIRRIYGYHFCIHRQLSHPQPLCCITLRLSFLFTAPSAISSASLFMPSKPYPPPPATISTKLSVWQKKAAF